LRVFRVARAFLSRVRANRLLPRVIEIRGQAREMAAVKGRHNASDDLPHSA